MKNRRKQRKKRARAAQQEQTEKTRPTIWQIIDGLLGLALAGGFLYWFFTGMWASCMSWLP